MDHDFIGGRADDTVVLAGLDRGAGVLSVSTHSDGIDAFITRLLTLCPFDHIPQSADSNRSPVCCVTGFCHRSEIPIAQAMVDRRLLSVSAMSARVLVWNVCNGIIPSSGNLGKVLDINWGLIPRMLDSARIGSILTTWYHTLWTQLPIETLSAAIASGIPVGVALGDFHRSPASRMSGIRLCLLGDPRTALPPASSPTPHYRQEIESQIEPRGRRHSAASVRDTTLEDAEFLRLWLFRNRSKQSAGRARQSAERAAEAVAAIR